MRSLKAHRRQKPWLVAAVDKQFAQRPEAIACWPPLFAARQQGAKAETFTYRGGKSFAEATTNTVSYAVEGRSLKRRRQGRSERIKPTEEEKKTERLIRDFARACATKSKQRKTNQAKEKKLECHARACATYTSVAVSSSHLCFQSADPRRLRAF